MAATNNTTSLSMGGTIGTRNFNDYTTRQISSAISRSNYRTKVVSDERLQKFREAVYKLVSGWAREDKLLIISEYGDNSLLGKNPNDETINRVCTESLIIHLDPGDLEKLYNDVMVETRNLKKDIAKIQNKRKQGRKLTISSFETAYEKVKGASNANKYKAARKAFDKGFKVPKNIESQYRTLRRELNDVLTTCFDVIEITGLAFQMGIDIEDGMKPKELRKAIINKTCLYVDLIVGKGKGGLQLSGAFMDREPYDKILSYTSYSYVTGRPGMDPSEWAILRTQAREAKRAIAERARMQRSRTRFSSRRFRSMTGVSGATLGSVARQLRKQDSGILRDMNLNELLELAGRYGIDPSRTKSEPKLKAMIYSAMAAENKRVQKLENLYSKGGSISRMRNLNDLLNIHKRPGQSPSSIIESYGNVPIITLSKTGMVNSESILRAVPVYIIGMGGAGDQPKMVGDNRNPYNEENFGARTVASEIKRGTISIGSYTHSKNNVESIDDLNQKDRDVFNFIMQLPESGAFNAKGARSIARSLDELEEQLKAAGVSQGVISKYKNYGINRRDQHTWRAAYLAWLYAYVNKKKKLMSYIENRYILPKFKTNIFIKGAISTGKLLASVLTLGIYNIRNIKNAYDEKRRTFKDPQSESDLPEKDKAALKELQKLDVSQLKVIARNYGYSIDKLNNVEKLDGETARWAFMAVIAAAKGFKILAKYCEFKGKLKDNDDYKTLKKSRGMLKKIATGFRILRNQAVFGNNPSMSPDERTESEEYEFDPRKNLGQRLPIPKIEYKGNGTVNEKAILEVLPVYVVNMFKGATDGSTEKVGYTEGIGSNVSNVEAYQRQNGLAPTNGRNDVLFTKDAATILAEMKSKGYTPTSRFITGLRAQAGRNYKVTNADLKWATANNFKFANGAYSFIAGDSLNSRPNPELVTIKGDGSFSVNPLASSSANGNSGMALSNTDKFAKGGGGVVGNLFLSPYEKLQKELQFINAKSSLANMASQAGLDPEEFGIMSATSEKQLNTITKKITKAIRKKKKGKSEEKENSTLSHEANSIGLSTISKEPIKPVYVVNKSLGTDDSSIKGSVDLVRSSVETNMSNLMLTLGGPWAVTAPMGVGAITNPLMIGTGVADKIMDTAVDVMDTAKSVLGQTLFSATGGRITKAATGGTVKRTGRGMPRFATGGSSIITGDAMGSNIFAGGAKPELVQTDGNTTVTPLNKTGTEQRYKIDRMTSTERNSALATAISSHIVKYNYILPSEASEVSNSGEAIKVFSVKPGITDVIDVAGEQTTLAALLANIYGQLALIAGNTGTGNELLTAIASKPVANVSGGGGGNTDSNPFAGGFPSSLDGILGGE